MKRDWSVRPGEPRSSQAWAIFTSSGHPNAASVRNTRREAIRYIETLTNQKWADLYAQGNRARRVRVVPQKAGAR